MVFIWVFFSYFIEDVKSMLVARYGMVDWLFCLLHFDRDFFIVYMAVSNVYKEHIFN